MTLNEARGVFGIPADAAFSMEAIHETYKKLARDSHPDMLQSSPPARPWSEVQEAYTLLKQRAERGFRCPSCKGIGEFPVMRGPRICVTPCKTCGGTGKI